MGQNPVNPTPGQPPYPHSGTSGPLGPSYGAPAGPGYGFQGPPPTPDASRAYGPQSTVPTPGYPSQPSYPPQPVPFAQGANPYGGPVQNPYGTPGPNPYAAPELRPAGRLPTKSRKGLLIGLLAGVGALVLIAVVAVVLITGTASGAASTEPDKASTPAAALQGFLAALSVGDADKAKLYAKDPPADSPLLTAAFLKSAIAKNPITEISVEPIVDSSATAFTSASYRIGPTAVHATYYLTKVGKIWKLDDVVVRTKRPAYWGKLAVTINGTTAPSDLAFFPGIYQLSTGTSLLEFRTPSFTVEDPRDYTAELTATTPAQVSVKGQQTMIAKSQELLAHCLVAQETNPKDCGMNTPLPAGATLAPGTVKRTVTTDGTPFAKSTVLMSSPDSSTVSISTYLPIAVEEKDTSGQVYKGNLVVVDATGTVDGENLTVVLS